MLRVFHMFFFILIQSGKQIKSLKEPVWQIKWHLFDFRTQNRSIETIYTFNLMFCIVFPTTESLIFLEDPSGSQLDPTKVSM